MFTSLTLALVLSQVAFVSEISKEILSLILIVHNHIEDRREASALYELLTYYDELPDEVLEGGDECLQQWQEDHLVLKLRASFWGCGESMTWLIGSSSLVTE
ncbi:hypothetical protein [Corynebacterium sp. HS2168-gen11]|uniref:hypothetical protein n=1 Tax=Corynebacterium sp. HS2168-gen11 TaxID=2974027 RepID=UPI00216B3EAF|nr:hypothetical protein [Corynebacterium sp. HS2168-gen11]MCS4536037.1 hypothetical protein [Corynebacterium sp. HS2168-gen11]